MKSAKLTESEWSEVFRLRCESKMGRAAEFTKKQRALIDRAYTENEERYSAMEADVFDHAAASIGSTRRWKR